MYDTCHPMAEPWKHYTKSKMPVIKDHILNFVFLYLHEMFKIGKSLETRSKLVVAGAWKEGRAGSG